MKKIIKIEPTILQRFEFDDLKLLILKYFLLCFYYRLNLYVPNVIL
jgi:hypothetical protein